MNPHRPSSSLLRVVTAAVFAGSIAAACLEGETQDLPPPQDPGDSGSLADADAGSGQDAGHTVLTGDAGAPSRCVTFSALTADALTAKFQGGTSGNYQDFWIYFTPATDTPWLNAGAYGTTALSGKTANLGTGVNASFDTCSHCLLLETGCATSFSTTGVITKVDCAKGKHFFPRTGTARFDQVAGISGQPFNGTFNKVELQEVLLDKNNVTTAVPDGGCLYVESFSFKATARAADGGTGDTGIGGAGPQNETATSMRQTGGASYSDCTATKDCSKDTDTTFCLGVTTSNTRICSRTCTSNLPCSASNGSCVAFNNGAAGFCLRSCSAAVPCPTGQICSAATIMGGGSGSVCIPW